MLRSKELASLNLARDKGEKIIVLHNSKECLSLSLLLSLSLSRALSLSFLDASFLGKSSARFASCMKYTIYMLINGQRSLYSKQRKAV
jgi:hypothetical protein